MNVKKLKLLAAFLVIIFIGTTGCGANLPDNTVRSVNDLSGKTVGVLAGSVSESYAAAYDEFHIKTFSDTESLAAELKNGGVDAVIAFGEISRELTKKASGFRALETPFISADYRIAVSQENKTLLTNVNSRLTAMQRDGTLTALLDAWLAGDGTYANTQPAELPVLTVAVDPTLYPFAFHDENGNMTGLEIELIRAICSGLGVTAEFQEVSSDMLLYMVESGKVSLAIGRLSEGGAVSYSDSYLTMVQDILVRKD